MTPYDKDIITQLLNGIGKQISSALSLADGPQYFSPSEEDRVRSDYGSLKSILGSMGTHVFDTNDARNFCHSSGLQIAASMTAKVSDHPSEIARSLRSAQSEVSDRLWRLSKWSVSD